MDIARGLSYLHNNVNIIHGNLTSSNVLLDDNYHARIADYGLSKLMTTAANSNVIATAGALGYRAPELSKLKKASTKTDVYSLGVIILELLTGKSPGDAANGVYLPQWVASIVNEEWTNEVFDLELMRDTAGNAGKIIVSLNFVCFGSTLILIRNDFKLKSILIKMYILLKTNLTNLFLLKLLLKSTYLARLLIL